METKQVFLEREEDDPAKAALEQASCMLSDGHKNLHLPECQLKFAT